MMSAIKSRRSNKAVKYLEDLSLTILTKNNEREKNLRPPKVRGKHFSNLDYLAEADLVWLTPDKSRTFPVLMYDKYKDLSYFDQCYWPLSKLGEGSFGSVLMVLGRCDMMFYAMKVSKEPYRNDKDRALKLKEVCNHHQFSKHPNIVTLHEAWEEDRYFYLQMELCQRNLVVSEPVPESQCWEILADMSSALAFIHDLGVAHFDVKLENIQLGYDGLYKLSDFGLVYNFKKDKKRLPEDGDAKYLAPELLSGSDVVSSKADIFSLGISVMELAGNLSLPANGQVWKALRENIFPFAQTAPKPFSRSEMTLLGPDLNQTELICLEIGESGPSKLDNNVKLVKEWILCQPHLPHNFDERILQQMIRGCKHDLERVKRKVDSYFSVRNTFPDIFCDRDPLNAELQRVARHLHITPLPKLTPQGHRVTIHRVNSIPQEDFDAVSVFKLAFMKADIRMVEETLIAGDVFVFDALHMSLAHIANLASPVTKNGLFCAQEAYPQRLIEIHILNPPAYIDKVVNIFKMFVRDKVKRRIKIHHDQDSLCQFIPKSVLPSNYGGDEKSIESLEGEWKKKLESFGGWFDKQKFVVTNEKLRQTKKTPSQSSDTFGSEGAFRKLAID